MKNVISLLFVFFLSNSAFSQMDDGKYKYGNNEITLTFTISGYGWDITDIKITNNATKKTTLYTGEMMKAGVSVWYQFTDNVCNFEFDVPTNKLQLSQNCEDGKKTEKKISVG